MDATVNTNKSNFTDDFCKEIEFLKNYDQNAGCDILNLLRILERQRRSISRRLEDLNIDTQDDIYQSTFQMDTILKLVSEKVNDDLFFHIDNLIFGLENNEYLKTPDK